MGKGGESSLNLKEEDAEARDVNPKDLKLSAKTIELSGLSLSLLARVKPNLAESSVSLRRPNPGSAKPNASPASPDMTTPGRLAVMANLLTGSRGESLSRGLGERRKLRASTQSSWQKPKNMRILVLGHVKTRRAFPQRVGNLRH